MNFSLNGYERETNPELQALGVVNYRNTTSCGTATAVSFPACFRSIPAASTATGKPRSTENLVNGADACRCLGELVDNNTAARGFRSHQLRKPDRRRTARFAPTANAWTDPPRDLGRNSGGDVEQRHRAASARQPRPLILPRYPEAFRRFTPTAGTPELMRLLDRGTGQHAYDNTILYTDHISPASRGCSKSISTALPAR